MSGSEKGENENVDANRIARDYAIMRLEFVEGCRDDGEIYYTENDLREIMELAKVSSEKYPTGAAVLARDIYVDDVVSGASSIESAILLRNELMKIMESGGFHLRKWTSNSLDFLNSLPSSELYSEDLKHFEERDDVSLKILGLRWQPPSDCFCFKTTQTVVHRPTKRTILSDIARIYDPLGFLCPISFHAKYIIQLLWTAGLSWDDDVPEDIASEWSRLKSQLSSLESIQIPRRMIKSFVDLHLHGFCDASERGYCAVIFCCVVDAEGACSVELCCAKSKVAPLRKLSVPRLELQAAVLLSDLMQSVVLALKPFHTEMEIFAWSDSTVALSWIKSCPSRWKTFVANRVSHIQEIIAPER
ncbi:pao retrotransposon peptidase domain-containing protein [Phthorimaea operculella]|nr:pao retrotransposon peptidase domain-containing protein [Phthorimaea operculella]